MNNYKVWIQAGDTELQLPCRTLAEAEFLLNAILNIRKAVDVEWAVNNLADGRTVQFEDFYGKKPDEALMGWNDFRIYVRNVVDARAALTPTDEKGPT